MTHNFKAVLDEWKSWHTVTTDAERAAITAALELAIKAQELAKLYPATHAINNIYEALWRDAEKEIKELKTSILIIQASANGLHSGYQLTPHAGEANRLTKVAILRECETALAEQPQPEASEDA